MKPFEASQRSRKIKIKLNFLTQLNLHYLVHIQSFFQDNKKYPSPSNKDKDTLLRCLIIVMSTLNYK